MDQEIVLLQTLLKGMMVDHLFLQVHQILLMQVLEVVEVDLQQEILSLLEAEVLVDIEKLKHQ